MAQVNKELHRKILDRFNIFNTLYEKFCEKYNNESFYLNKDLLYIAIKSYFDDIEKFKQYSGSILADQHKQAAFTIKWISKIKPIQINPNFKINKQIILINSLFAIFTGSSFLLKVTPENIPMNYYKHLIYSTLYRDIDAKQLAGALFLLEEYANQSNGEK